MRWPENNPFPAGLTAKKLYKQSAEKFADLIAKRALPVIELYLAEDEFYQYYYFPTRRSILEYLARLRIFFWEETLPWLGPIGCSIREIVDEAIVNILYRYSEVTAGPRDQQIFTIFVFQLLFRRKVSDLPSANFFGVDHLCRNLKEFLSYMGPFSITSLQCVWIAFYDNKTFFPLLEYCPKLTYIRLGGSFYGNSLIALTKYCPLLERIDLDVSMSEYVQDLQEGFCKAFFQGMSSKDLQTIVENNQTMSLTFPRLKALIFHSNNDYDCQSLIPFMFYLQYAYKDIKVRWFHVLEDESAAASVMDSGILCPSFIEENDRFSFDGLIFEMMMEGSDDEEDLMEGINNPVFLKANYISIFFNQYETFNHNFVEELLRKFQCHSIKIVYSSVASGRLFTQFGTLAPSLSELYLDGPLVNMIDGEQLFLFLSFCVNLIVLGLKLDLVFNPRWPRPIEALRKLKILSVKVIHYPFWQKFAMNDESDEFLKIRLHTYMEEHGICNNLPAYMQPYGASAVDNTTPDPTENIANSRSFPPFRSNLEITEDTPNLIKIFGSSSLKYDVPPAINSHFGFGVLEQSHDKGCLNRELSSTMSIYRKPVFAFYGDEKFSYKLCNYITATDISSCSQSTAISKSDYNSQYGHLGQHYPANKNYGQAMYGHLLNNTKKFLIYNRHCESRENKLKQWRLDMDFSAPYELLTCLLQSTYNLEILEIPDLRFFDAPLVFEQRTLSQRLSKCHTLHISSQYTEALANRIIRFPSLRVLRIDPQYGSANFLRFHKRLRWTGISLELGDSLVYPGSECLEDLEHVFDKWNWV